MQHVIAAASPAACSTGSWTQKWNCGWHQPTTTAANAGYFAGHNVGPVLIAGIIIGLILIALTRGSRSRTPVTSK